MSCIYKIKKGFGSFTQNEKIIAQDILDHRNEAIEKSAQELGEVTHTSAASWIRFSQKLGFKGLTALKVDLAKNLDEDQEEDEIFNVVIEEQDSLNVMVKKIQTINAQHMEGTYKLLNIDSLRTAIDWMDSARRIYLTGIGGSGIACLDLMHKLTRIDKDVVYYEDMHILAARIAHINQDDVLIALSYSGETPIINDLAKFAKGKGAKVIAITQYNTKSTLASLADNALYIPVKEKELRLGSITSRNSTLAFTDLLYYCLSKLHYDQTKNDLIKTRQLIQLLNS